MTMHAYIAWAITSIDEHLDERLTLNEPGARAGLGRRRFCAAFGLRADVSPPRYIRGQRLWTAQSLLADGESPTSAALMVGFHDRSHRCRHFNNTCGRTPDQYISCQRGAKGTAACNHEREVA